MQHPLRHWAPSLGTAVKILGNNLTGSSTVTFNGKSATFIVVSNTEIKTAVPNGATIGRVKVVTPKGTFDRQRDLPGA